MQALAMGRRALAQGLTAPWTSALRRNGLRTASTVSVEPTDVDGVQVLYMNSKPVNALSLNFVQSLIKNLEEVEADESNKGLVLASSVSGIFSAGLDIREMHDQKEPHLRTFWSSLQELWLKLNTTRLATAAAIEGNSPAGGCLLALSCDERVMADSKISIGLNETRLGIVAPPWFVDSFRAAVGQRHADRLLQQGELLSPHEARGVGLIDYVRSREDVIPTCVELLEDYIAVPEQARHLSKLSVRKHIVDVLASDRKADIDFFVEFITQEHVQESIGKYLQALAKRQPTTTN